MGIFDKLKNALFEEEYVEVEEKSREIKQAPKKSRQKETIRDDIRGKYRDEKPIAKKIVLPEKKEKRIEEPENVLDDDLEIEKSVIRDEEQEQEQARRQFRVMEDDDFEIDEREKHYQVDAEPQIVKVIEKEEQTISHAYQGDKENLYHGRVPNQPYGSLESPKTTVGDYRTYETRIEEKTHFKPSPIISPIYGVLDKNYKKDDVVSKREVKFTSSFAREKLNVDDIRKKAFGVGDEETADEVKKDTIKPTFEVETTTNLLVDLSSDDSKPSVKEVTVGDAVEYFEDLGLEYNVDYLDASKKASGRRVKENYDEAEMVSSNAYDEEPKFVDKKEDSLDEEDNLFDLIDSMYQEQE